MDDEKWLNNKLQYFIFNEYKEKLNLSICNEDNKVKFIL